MRYRFVDEALAEYIEAGCYYNAQAEGLGDAFVDEIEAAISVVLKNPTVFRIVEGDVRRYLVKRFPYGIYYTIEEDLVLIWAIRNLHREEDYWLGRRG
jgi:toxin ParE1/3/4